LYLFSSFVFPFFLDPPAIITHPSTINTSESKNVVLTCKRESKPQANVRWLKGGVPLTIDGSRMETLHPWSYRSSVATLTINNINRTDEGNYACQASNGIGSSVTSSTAFLNVDCKYFILDK